MFLVFGGTTARDKLNIICWLRSSEIASVAKCDAITPSPVTPSKITSPNHFLFHGGMFAVLQMFGLLLRKRAHFPPKFKVKIRSRGRDSNRHVPTMSLRSQIAKLPNAQPRTQARSLPEPHRKVLHCARRRVGENQRPFENLRTEGNRRLQVKARTSTLGFSKASS